jgi:hypothetical protein
MSRLTELIKPGLIGSLIGLIIQILMLFFGESPAPSFVGTFQYYFLTYGGWIILGFIFGFFLGNSPRKIFKKNNS